MRIIYVLEKGRGIKSLGKFGSVEKFKSTLFLAWIKMKKPHFSKDAIPSAISDARRLMREPIPSKEDIKESWEQAQREALKLRGLLEPSWFVNDTDVLKNKLGTGKNSSRRKTKSKNLKKKS